MKVPARGAKVITAEQRPNETSRPPPRSHHRTPAWRHLARDSSTGCLLTQALRNRHSVSTRTSLNATVALVPRHSCMPISRRGQQSARRHDPASRNTVQLDLLTAMFGGLAGCGQCRWWARLTCHRVYLRLITRGLERGRRPGLRRRASQPMARRQSASTASASRGGKVALMGDGAAGDPQGGDEADVVGVTAGMLGGVGHQRADGVVAAQVSPDLLQDEFG
jgi:hypothetical protein